MTSHDSWTELEGIGQRDSRIARHGHGAFERHQSRTERSDLSCHTFGSTVDRVIGTVLIGCTVRRRGRGLIPSAARLINLGPFWVGVQVLSCMTSDPIRGCLMSLIG